MPDRDETIKIIRNALKKRSGKSWSVTGGRGTAWGWITIDAPPSRRTWKYVQTKTAEPPCEGAVYCGTDVTPHYGVQSGEITDLSSDPWTLKALAQGQTLVFTWEVEDPTCQGHTSPAERKELGELLGKDRIHYQGESVPSGGDYRAEYIARAKGEKPTKVGEPYWD